MFFVMPQAEEGTSECSQRADGSFLARDLFFLSRRPSFISVINARDSMLVYCTLDISEILSRDEEIASVTRRYLEKELRVSKSTNNSRFSFRISTSMEQLVGAVDVTLHILVLSTVQKIYRYIYRRGPCHCSLFQKSCTYYILCTLLKSTLLPR